MDFGGPVFVLGIVTICMAAWLINNWIRAKHGYSLEDGMGRKIERTDNGTTAKLLEENARLSDRLEAYEDRVNVLERIVTDRGYSVAHEIEALRDREPRLESRSRSE